VAIKRDEHGRLQWWSANINTHWAPVLRVLRARYGRPIDPYPDTCSEHSCANFWDVDGQRVEVWWSSTRVWDDRVWLDITPARER
jgi:hypothetical protein